MVGVPVDVGWQRVFLMCAASAAAAVIGGLRVSWWGFEDNPLGFAADSEGAASADDAVGVEPMPVILVKVAVVAVVVAVVAVAVVLLPPPVIPVVVGAVRANAADPALPAPGPEEDSEDTVADEVDAAADKDAPTGNAADDCCCCCCCWFSRSAFTLSRKLAFGLCTGMLGLWVY